jgi:gamma-butyrobetaine dioxygenase
MLKFYRPFTASTKRVLLNSNSLILDIPEPTKFHYNWLRDNCQCEFCIHPSTKQKLHSSGKVGNPKPKSVKYISEDLVEIQWNVTNDLFSKKEHQSIFNINWLRKNNYNKVCKPLVAPILWDSAKLKQQSIEVDYEAFQTEQGFKNCVKLLYDYGIAIIKNLPSENTIIVEDVAKKFGSILETFYGKSWDVRSVPNSKNIAYTSLFLSLHMDLMYLEAPPGLQLLHCLKNRVNGGTSLFLDMFAIVEKLKTLYPRQYEILKSVPVKFEYDNDGKHYEYLRPTIQETINDKYNIFYSPPFQGAINADPSMIDDFYEAFGTLEQIVDDEQYLYKYLLREGDVVLFANRRVLHGRESFDESGERWLKGTYVAWDDVKDKFRMCLRK